MSAHRTLGGAIRKCFLRSVLFPMALVGAISILAGQSVSAQTTILTIAGDPWPPYIIGATRGGLAVDVVRAALKQEGYGVELEVLPWARAEQGVKTGVYDLLVDVWRTRERSVYLDFGTPYAMNTVKFIKRKGDPFEYHGLESLKGKSIGTIRGYGYGDAFLASDLFLRDESPSFMSNIQKLLQGRVDLTLEDELVARTMLKESDPNLLDLIEFTRESLSQNALYVASGFANPRHEKIISAYNRGLAAIKANGTFDRIMEKYGLR
ncbi:MAG: transporter substrate-binding domain-containing protein [Treponema sp.]|nr:transporter substrate-binding domain-containing protein [Treponema sp.]